jgi:hypothetical protein
MSSRAAVTDASTPRLLVVEEGQALDVFDVLTVADGIARVRSPFLFEVGEELPVRFEVDGRTADTTARVRGHVGPQADRITGLELGDPADRSD